MPTTPPPPSPTLATQPYQNGRGVKACITSSPIRKRCSGVHGSQARGTCLGCRIRWINKWSGCISVARRLCGLYQGCQRRSTIWRVPRRCGRWIVSLCPMVGRWLCWLLSTGNSQSVSHFSSHKRSQLENSSLLSVPMEGVRSFDRTFVLIPAPEGSR